MSYASGAMSAENELLNRLLARVPASIAEMSAYVPDPTPVPVRLDANEAPALLPTLTTEERSALIDALAAIEPARYPDVRATALRAAIAKSLGVSGDQLVLGVGSDEVIAMLIATLARTEAGARPSILVPSPTFVMYRVSARVHGYDVLEVPLDADWDVDEGRVCQAIRETRPAIVFLATPNNPTSGAYDRARVTRIVELAASMDPPSVVVVDEAYLPFREACDPDPWQGTTGLDLLARYPNVVVLRTLSKVGLAAFRVGWAVAQPRLAAEIDKTLPYDLPTPSQAGALAAFGPLAGAIERHVTAIAIERERLLGELRRFERVRFGRTHANFVWMELEGIAASTVAANLKERGILVRSFAAYPTRIRASVGTRSDDDRFLESLDDIVRRT